VYINIHGKDLVADLNKQGIKSPKAHNVTFNDLGSYEMNLAFLQGYYDGDGNAKGAGVCSCSWRILEQFKNYFNIPFDIKHRKNVYYLNIGMKLKRIMNQNMTNSIPRKRASSNMTSLGKGYKPYHNPRKFEVTKEKLTELIMTKNWREIGKIYGVSDTAVKKRANLLEIDWKTLKGT